MLVPFGETIRACRFPIWGTSKHCVFSSGTRFSKHVIIRASTKNNHWTPGSWGQPNAQMDRPSRVCQRWATLGESHGLCGIKLVRPFSSLPNRPCTTGNANLWDAKSAGFTLDRQLRIIVFCDHLHKWMPIIRRRCTI